MSDDVYLFVACGYDFGLQVWSLSIGVTDKTKDILSVLLNDNVPPPFVSHKFNSEDFIFHKFNLNDVICIRDYLNEYIKTNTSDI